MTDIVTKSTRSRMMANIRTHDTTPELAIRSALHRLGCRFRLHNRDLPGKPDITLARYRAAIFVHGCFWHRHPGCRYAATPKSNRTFWRRKFEENVARDAEAIASLAAHGWRVAVVWECSVRNDLAQDAARALAAWRASGRTRLTLPLRPPWLPVGK